LPSIDDSDHGIVNGFGEKSSIHDHFVVKYQDGRLSGLKVGEIIIPSLSQNIPKNNSSLESINKVFLKFERGGVVKLPISHFNAIHGYLSIHV
jgi:hypothetical protein